MHAAEMGLVLPTMLALVAVASLAMNLTQFRALGRSRQELAAERKRTELVIRATQTGIFDWDVTSNRIDYSERFKEILGFPLNADLSDRTRHFDSVHPEDRERARAAFVAHLREGRDNRNENLHPPIEYRLRRADGGYTWVRGTGLSLRGRDGRTTRYIASIIDISERKRQELELQNQVKFIGDLFDLVPLSLAYRDTDGRFRMVNRTWERYFGYPRAQVLGRTMLELAREVGGDPSRAEAIFAEDRQALDLGPGGSTEPRDVVYRDRHYLQTRTAMADAERKLIGVLITGQDMTEQQKMQEALRTQQQRLELVVRASKIGIIDWDGVTRTGWYSDRFKEMLGYAAGADFSGWSFFEAVHPEDSQTLRAAVVATLKGQSGSDSLTTEYRMRRADGSYIWVIGTGLALRGADGRATRFLTSVGDISERRAQEQALRDQAKLTRDLIDGNPNPVYLKDEDCRFLEINTAYSDLTRVTPEQAKGRNVFDLYATERAAVFDRQDRELLARGEGSSAIEVDYQFPDRRRHFLMSKTILKRADGSVRGLVGTLTEITQFKAIEHDLRVEQQRLSLVVRASQVGIIDGDTVNRTTFYSDRFKELLGYPVAIDASNWNFFDLIHPEDRKHAYDAYVAHLKGADPAVRDSLILEYRMLRADGSHVWVQGMGLSLRDETGRSIRFLAAITDISERRRQEEALRTQQQRLDLVIRGAQAGIVDWSAETRTTWYSERFKEMLGYPVDADTSGWPDYWEMVHPDERAKGRESHRAYLKGMGAPRGETVHDPLEYRIRRADGTWLWVQGRGVSVRDATGRAARFLAAITDISARRAQEQALREQMDLTRDLIRALPNPLFLKDAQFRFVHVNPGWEKMSGIPAEKAVGGLVHEVYPPEFAEDFARQDRELLASPTGTHTMEITIPGRKKTRHYILAKALLRREDGTLRGMVGSCTDITEQKLAEHAVRENEERMRFWLENIPIPIAIYDPEGGVQYLNSAFSSTFGWKLEEMRGKRMPFVPEHRREQLTGVLQKLLTVGKDAFETERMTKDGRNLDIYISTGMARAADGTPRATMVSLMDVTERKRMERELSASREEALQAAQAKAAFLAAMSHEIRTPLNGVLGMAGLLEGTALTPEQREYVETIQVSGDALLAVINDVLDYSKIESGRMELEQEPLEPVRAIEESLEILGERARAKGLELIAETADELPQWVLGDLARLRQVLVNLVGNAVKFTDAGEVVVEARLAAPEAIEFRVRDTGIGIPKERIASLFEAFTQVDASTTRKYGGTGLGLAISRRLVALMGGELRVASEPGRGSTFSFTMRARPCAPSAATRAAPPVRSLEGKRLLVVDDNETNLRILARQVERWGAQPVAERTAAAALARVAAGEEFDAALLDYHMPGMDGVMLARELRRRGSRLPLVLLSSSMYRRAEEAEADLFAAQLLKPIRQQQLQAAIASAIAGQRFEPVPLRRAPAAAGPAPRALADGLPLRILVADDVEVNRRLVAALLRNFGYAADSVASGREAVESAVTGNYDLVLMDVQMPDIDGLEATRRIRERMGPRHPRIVALTASAMAGDRERCLQAGMDDYLAKPIQPNALRAALEKAGGEGRRQSASAGRRVAMAAPGAIDWRRIESLAPYDPDGSMVAGAISSFLADAPGRVKSIRSAHAAADAAALAAAAHALKGAAANIGAAEVEELSRRIEALAQQGELAAARKAIAGLNKSLSAANAALKAYARKASRGS